MCVGWKVRRSGKVEMIWGEKAVFWGRNDGRLGRKANEGPLGELFRGLVPGPGA